MSTPVQRLVFKRGDTVMLGCAAFDAAGLPADLTGVDITSQVWPEKEGLPMVAAMEVEFTDRALGTYELWAPGDGLATGWPTGNLRIDVQYSQPHGARTLRRSTETFYLFIERDVTQ